MQELAPHDRDLASCEVRAETEVGTGRTETVVIIGRATNVKDVGVDERFFVAIGRVVKEQHFVTGFKVET